jgi:hypothetical protein
MIFERIPVSHAPVHFIRIDGETFYTAGGVLARRGECRERIARREEARREEIVKTILGMTRG